MMLMQYTLVMDSCLKMLILPKKVIDAGIVWIGPSPKAVALMGEKAEAKEQAKIAGVPVLEGVKIDEESTEDERLSIIRDVGFPLLIKATYGGGGRGDSSCGKRRGFEQSFTNRPIRGKNAFGSTGGYGGTLCYRSTAHRNTGFGRLLWQRCTSL